MLHPYLQTDEVSFMSDKYQRTIFRDARQESFLNNLKQATVNYVTVYGEEVDKSTDTGLRVITLPEPGVPLHMINPCSIYARHFYKELVHRIRLEDRVILTGDEGTAKTTMEAYVHRSYL